MVLDRLVGTLSATTLFPTPPLLRFRGEVEVCPDCGGDLKVWKTQSRHPVTLHIGRFVAHETVLYCERCAGCPVFRSEELAGLVAPGRTFGHDVMVYAGEALLCRNLTVAETLEELAQRNVRISASETRELAARFIVSLSLAHAAAAPRLREGMQVAGGYILHLDSTCKGGSPHLLTGIDEISGFVLLNAKVPSESTDEIRAFFRRVKEQFGTPVAVVSDMAKGILGAALLELNGTPLFICHFHFLRDLGKDLLSSDYDTLRNGLRQHGLKAELKRFQRTLHDAVEAHAEPLKTLLLTIETGRQDATLAEQLPAAALLGAFTASILDAEDQGDGCGFPFDHPHLWFFRQAQSVLKATDALRRNGPFDGDGRKLCARFIAMLTPTCEDPVIEAAATALEDKTQPFNLFRQAMQIAEPGAGKGLNDTGGDLPISTIKQQVQTLCDRFRHDPAFMARKEYRAMLTQVDHYQNQLFADPIHVQTPQGSRILQPQRTNNILEQFFRNLGRQTCKRTGHRITETTLHHLLPDTPLVANLANARYIEILLNGEKTLAHCLAKIDQRLVNDTLNELRKPPTGIDRKTRAQLRAKATPLQIALYILKNAA